MKPAPKSTSTKSGSGLACNIDQRGRRARLISGAVVVLCGGALIVAGLIVASKPLLAVGVFLDVAGAFMIFEGARGWCVLRAMGIKTPM